MPKPRKIVPGAIAGIEAALTTQILEWGRARELLEELEVGGLSLRGTLDSALNLARAVERTERQNVTIQQWCKGLDVRLYFNEDAWGEARDALTRLQAATLYMARPAPDSFAMTLPDRMARDALDTIKRLANR
ncbi:hypothetical protein GIW81_00785 [Hyphomicrobium sp. xq]|uniref:Uncharacterized protein n=1 Tax=Hyphomicrobium album TaxID=2665159 RepID=A0A6I3KEU7_9HYPH|nr:hypothetical protein [Hyphomicrobium album]MTD92863.1 hypothetical protein [Hyphomicrobium album]